MASSRAAHTTIGDRLTIIVDALNRHDDFASKELPGFKSLLEDCLAPSVDVDRTDFTQRLLKVFKDSRNNAFQDFLAKHDDDERSRVNRFVDGEAVEDCARGFQMRPSLAAREETDQLLSAPMLKSFADAGAKPTSFDRQGCLSLGACLARLVPLFKKENEKRPALRIHEKTRFRNWGRTVDYKPSYTCVPTTVGAVQEVVRFAKEHNLAVRVAACRHSWAPIFGRNGDITLPNTTALPLPEDPPTELESIEFTNDAPLPGGQRLVRVGCATTNERLRRWCLNKNTVTLPLDVIMVETTLGGSTSAMCHGSGRHHNTISDLVKRIEYVDANGELRTITEKEPELLKSTAGCFGIIGVVTHITLAFDPMSYAVMRPIKLPVIETIPPPSDMADDMIPPALRPKVPLTAEQKQKIQKDFEDRANNDFYAERFWFPYNDECWINTWNNTTDSSDVIVYPDDVKIFLEFAETVAVNVIQDSTILNELVKITGMAEAEVTIISFFGMQNFADVKEGEQPIKTYLPDALHYQRAIQNVRVRELEIEMPLTAKKGEPDKVDYSNVQRAWWDAIRKVYEHSDACPQRMPIEMRIMGDSNMTMSAQRGNSLGTCCIGVLTLESAKSIWPAYAQEVLDKWMSYTDAEGKKLNTRPHWAKEWVAYKVDGKPWLDKLKTDYKDAIAEFKRNLSAIGQGQRWTLNDLKARFSNDLFDELLFEDVGSVKQEE